MGPHLNEDPARKKKCKKCGEEKLVLIDFPLKIRRNSCKKCNSKDDRLDRQKRYGMKPENHWRFKRFGPGPNLKDICGQEDTQDRKRDKKVTQRSQRA